MVGTRVATVSDRSEADLFQSLLVRLLPPSLPEVSLPLLLRCHADIFKILKATGSASSRESVHAAKRLQRIASLAARIVDRTKVDISHRYTGL